MGGCFRTKIWAEIGNSTDRATKEIHNGEPQKVRALENWYDNQEGYIAAQISQAALRHYREDSETWVRVLQSEHGGFF